MFQKLRSALSSRVIFRGSLVLCVLSLGLLGYVFYQANSFDLPISGGTFREGEVGSIATINPLFAQFNPAEEDTVRLVYSGLTKFDPKQQKIVPDLATFQVSNDYKEYVFSIHPDAKWHDGTPVTADDVVFTYAVIADPAFSNALLKRAFEGTKVTKVDEKTVQFILPTSYSFFPTATTLGILPKHIWQDIPVEGMSSDPLGQRPIGSGPFKVDGSLAPSTSGEQIVTLTRNDEYYGDKPYLENIILQFYPTFENLLEKKNSLVAMSNIPFDYVDAIRDMERFELYEIDEPKFYAAYLNVENETLQDARTRVGLSLGIDRNTLLEPYAFLKPSNSPFSYGSEDSWKTEYYPDRAKGGLFDAGWKFPSNEQIEAKKKVVYQEYLSGTLMPETASGATLTGSGGTLVATGSGATITNITNGMLEEATLDGKRLSDIIDDYQKYRVSSKGQEFTLRLVTLNVPEYLPEMTRKIAQSWEDIGVKTEVSVFDTRDIQSVIKNRKYDVIIIGQELGYDADIFPYWHSSAAKLSGYNLSNFKNTTLDKLLETMRKPTSQLSEEELAKKRQEQMRDIASLLQEEMPAIFLFQRKNYFAVDKKIKNVYIQNLITPKDRYAYADTWYEASGKQLREELSARTVLDWIMQMLRA